MAILNGALQRSEPVLTRGQRMPIDNFLRSLADDQADRAIGIILSGTATDGTLGLRAILGAGGVCMVQHNINEMAAYARFLKPNPAEMQALFKELLINVTS